MRPTLTTIFLLTSSILPTISALKFDIAAHSGGSNNYERCIRNYAAADTLVVVTAISDGFKGDGQTVNMHVRPLVYLQHPPKNPHQAEKKGRTSAREYEYWLICVWGGL